MTEKKLSVRILRMYATDQDMRMRAFKEQWPLSKRMKIRDLDLRNRPELKRIITSHGWPTFDLVGKKAAHAFWVLVQHADEDLSFQKKCLNMMKQAFKVGQALPEDLAFLTDRVMLNTRKKQCYGTQFRLVDGVREPYPIIDRKNVDRRRKAVGMSTLAVATRKHNALLKKLKKIASLPLSKAP